jgi:hypothetical protein
MKRSPLKRGPMPRRRRTKHQEANVEHAEYLTWIHDQPCCVCGTMQNIQAAYVGQGGTGMKHGSDAETIPLCGPHGFPVAAAGTARGCHAEHDQFTGYFKGWKLSRRREWDEQQVAIHRGRFEASAGRGAVA